MNETLTKEVGMENGSDNDECFYEVLQELEDLSKYKKDEAKKLVEKFKVCRAKPKAVA